MVWIEKLIKFSDLTMGLHNQDFKPVGYVISHTEYLNIPIPILYLPRIRINRKENRVMYGSPNLHSYNSRTNLVLGVDINQKNFDLYKVEKREHNIQKLLPPELEPINLFGIKIGYKKTTYI